MGIVVYCLLFIVLLFLLFYCLFVLLFVCFLFLFLFIFVYCFCESTYALNRGRCRGRGDLRLGEVTRHESLQVEVSQLLTTLDLQ